VNHFLNSGIPSQQWVKLATLNFVGTADFLLQFVETIVKEVGWVELCAAVCARFEKDQHNSLLRQFFHIQQQSTVSDYIEHFDELGHQIRAHDPTFSAALATSRFIDGLRADIKAVVMIHKPIYLDTASYLALLQEELTVPSPRRDGRRADTNYSYKFQPKLSPNGASSSVPATPHKSPQFSSPDEKKHVDSLKLQSSDEILSAIKAYRRTKGLCYNCGVKWSPGHKCAPTVALHVVEELWQLLQDPASLTQAIIPSS